MPGVTDNVGNTAAEIISEKLNFNQNNFKVNSSQLFLLLTQDKSVVDEITSECSNLLINKIFIKSFNEYIESKKDVSDVDIKSIKKQNITKHVNLNLSVSDLKKIGKEGIIGHDGKRRGTLGLDIESLKEINKYFKLKSRHPTDIEIETLAQTWSEHCKHKIFSSKMDNSKEGLFNTYIKNPTKKIIKVALLGYG